MKMRKKTLILAGAALAVMILVPAATPHAKDKAPVYNKAGSGGSAGPVSLSDRKGGGGNAGSDEDQTSLPDRIEMKKERLRALSEEQSRENEALARAMLEQSNIEVQRRAAMDAAVTGEIPGGMPGGTATQQKTQKKYVYDPDGGNDAEDEDAPGIVVTPPETGTPKEDEPFRVFKFNKDKK